MKTRCRKGVREAAAMLKGQPWFDKYDPRSNVVDALTALLHFADAKGFDFEDALSLARGHQAAEQTLDARNASRDEI